MSVKWLTEGVPLGAILPLAKASVEMSNALQIAITLETDALLMPRRRMVSTVE
jgi:hypothetical protein